MIKPVANSWLAFCGVLVLGVGVLVLATDGFRAFTEEAARRLDAARNKPALPALVLEDMRGEELRLGHQAGQDPNITLVTFIYTSCPTICVVAGSDFAVLRDRLKERLLHNRVRLVSLSFDPARDDPAQMRLYAEQHGADGDVWTIARPRAAAVSAVTKSFGVRIIPDGLGGYQHNAAIHLVDRDGRLAGIFDTDDIDGVLSAVQDRL